MKLEFDPDKGYGSTPVRKKRLERKDYLTLPVIRWCHERIGPIRWPKSVNEVLTGEGWQIYAQWDDYLKHLDNKPRTYVIINKDIDQRLITEFWMRFQ